MRQKNIHQTNQPSYSTLFYLPSPLQLLLI